MSMEMHGAINKQPNQHIHALITHDAAHIAGDATAVVKHNLVMIHLLIY